MINLGDITINNMYLGETTPKVYLGELLVFGEDTPTTDYTVTLTYSDGTTQVDTYEDGIIPNDCYRGSSALYVEIGNGITTLGDGAFEGCDMYRITFTNKITSIGSTCFRNCTNLQAIYYLGTVEEFSKVEVGDRLVAGTNISEVQCEDGTAPIL